ncbi:unnamed protein product [Eruca vesicaria subsp. sativa]|uniref:Uncharacterized protein n=1 Tax=Eruca vesicaria subsp. sativa TaxID=29727 RepID=A0ABC8JND5_ERUVS|nr:unnamed protein product [Eruca vesicaria subsp. sativa]
MDVEDSICALPTYWNLAFPDLFIAAAPEPVYDFFQIQKMEDFLGGYKIVFCSNGEDCVDVGISVGGDGVRRLVVDSKPFEVVFVKATQTKASANNKT